MAEDKFIKKVKKCIMMEKVENELLPTLNEIFSPIFDLDSNKIQVFVHGSWADNSRTAFSDLDDFIIIDDDYIESSKEALEKIALNFQLIDPLQHHGHWQVKRSNLQNYDNSYIPLFIMKNAVCVYGSPHISATIDYEKSRRGVIENIITTCKNIEQFFEQYKNRELNIYSLKAFVGSIALIPPLLFQVKGISYDKRTAILKSEDILVGNSIKAIKWATDLRANWDLIIRDEDTKSFFQQIRETDSSNAMREFASVMAPVLDYSELSDIVLSSEIIDSFVNCCIRIIDEAQFKKLKITDYEAGYKKVEKCAIENNAVLVGQFGKVNHPGISDLDVLICFKESDFVKGCRSVQELIEKDINLAYLFTHPPYFTSLSTLGDIGNIHTLSDISLSYKNSEVKIPEIKGNVKSDFLNLIWSYLVFKTILDFDENKLRFCSSRRLFLILKMVHKSNDFLNKLFSLNSTDCLKRSENLRQKVLISNQLYRDQLLSEFKQSRTDYLKTIGNIKVFNLPRPFLMINENRIFKIENNEIEWITKKKKFGVIYEFVPSVFFKLLQELFYESSKCAKLYMKASQKVIRTQRGIGFNPDPFTFVFDEESYFQKVLKKKFQNFKWGVLQKIKSIFR